ncbi:hypothetical protein [Thiohalomonas denitrificans]|uniref:Polysaccharide lyase n=1 Tax=Thiohalomonas denitrificans TaxID=415747 RepID=A0A1G5Q360_9GAMM|nr:hypothetical protein [Thiohalomonas denitrificans]SCZ56068.1 hypothetical protein SAMN03097708_01259 [Thiohalomonas denitrificans]
MLIHRTVSPLLLAVGLALSSSAVSAAESFCPKGSDPDPAVLWCDSFEDEDLGPKGTVAENYAEYNDDDGDFRRTTSQNAHGKYALQARFQSGEVSAGWLYRHFGRNPLGSQSHGSSDFREIYWRYYTKLQDGFIGYPDKSSRVTIFANGNRAQAMIGHIWSDSSDRAYLKMDPASGIEDDRLVTTKWNDFSNLTWLGARKGTTPLQAGKWHCVESRIKLNSPGKADGIFEYRIDGKLQASRTDLNWVGRWDDYGINSVMLENYWNSSSPADQKRYLDAFVISTQPIGCVSVAPNPPTNVSVQ